MSFAKDWLRSKISEKLDEYKTAEQARLDARLSIAGDQGAAYSVAPRPDNVQARAESITNQQPTMSQVLSDRKQLVAIGVGGLLVVAVVALVVKS